MEEFVVKYYKDLRCLLIYNLKLFGRNKNEITGDKIFTIILLKYILHRPSDRMYNHDNPCNLQILIFLTSYL